MATKWYYGFATILSSLAFAEETAMSEERTWSDSTGTFTVSAELVDVDAGKAVLRRSDGKEIRVPLARLSEADRAFIKAQEHDASLDAKQANKDITEIATRFFEDLRTKERAVARQSLTNKAASLMKGGQSPLTGLPEPQQEKTAIRVGSAQLDGEVAEIPVFVRAGGALHKTKLHLRKEGDEWHVFAISAIYPDGEKSINFESGAAAQQRIDPLQELVGKGIDLEGYTLDGGRVNLGTYKGKIVLVDFWATWCGPCRAEIPNIRQNWDKHHSDGFDVIAVSVDQDLAALGSFVMQEQPPWTVVADNYPNNHKSMGGKYGINAIPAFILVGKDGKVAAVNCRGQRLGEQLEKLLARN